MDFMKKRWIILLASGIAGACTGVMNAWSLIALPLSEHLSSVSGMTISATSLAIVFTVANSMGPIPMILAGFINDRVGPRIVLVIGGILFGYGLIGGSMASSVMGLVLTTGLGIGLGNGSSYNAIVSNSVKLFPDKGGMAGGFITACVGISSALISYSTATLLTRFEITTVMKILGTVIMVVIASSAIIIKPAPKGFKVEAAAAKKTVSAVPIGNEMTCLQMIKTPSFYIMMCILACGAFSGMLNISQLSSISKDMMGFSVTAAASMVSMLSVFNMGGRFAIGALSDRIGEIKSLAITVLLALIANVMLFFCTASTVFVFYVCVALVGFTYGGVMAIFPVFTANRFGRKNNSVNYAIMFIGMSFASIVGPMVVTRIYAATASYKPAFLVAVALSLVGELLIFAMSRRIKSGKI